ncbi:MAG: hypothetical protein V5A84_00805 [Planctomycetota bacterium]
MTELLKEMLQSEIFWKALGAAVAAVWSLPAVQWFRRELREHRMGMLLDAARDVGTGVYRTYRRGMLDGEKDPDEARDEAVAALKERLRERAPRLAGRLAEEQLRRFVNDAFDELEMREARKRG